MHLSAFEVIGPVMVGPSSSHTAGAVRLGLAARGLLGETPRKAVIGLHGSFAATGRGHATDRALLAGILGFPADDVRLPRSPELAQAFGLEFSLVAEDLGEAAHPNSARVQLFSANHTLELVGASLGGGLIETVLIDGYPTSFRANLNTTVFWHRDERGFLAKITAVLACAEVNIAALRTSRQRKGDRALTTIETDCAPSDDALRLLEKMSAVSMLRHLTPLS
jgi:L-serine dehydratase